MIHERFAERFEDWLGLIRDHHTVYGSSAQGRITAENPRDGFVGDPDAGIFYHPTIVDGVTLEDDIYRTETFGPIVGVATFKTFDEAMQLANDHGYGLSSSIYTTSGTNAFRFRERITAGMVSVNNSTSGAEAHLPFGGNGKSGNGSRQSGIWVLDQFTRWQSMNWDYAGKLQKAQMDLVEVDAYDPSSRSRRARLGRAAAPAERGEALRLRGQRLALGPRERRAAARARRRAACPSCAGARGPATSPSTSAIPAPPSDAQIRLRTASSGTSTSRSLALASGSRFGSSRAPSRRRRVERRVLGEHPAFSPSWASSPARAEQPLRVRQREIGPVAEQQRGRGAVHLQVAARERAARVLDRRRGRRRAEHGRAAVAADDRQHAADAGRAPQRRVHVVLAAALAPPAQVLGHALGQPAVELGLDLRAVREHVAHGLARDVERLQRACASRAASRRCRSGAWPRPRRSARARS